MPPAPWRIPHGTESHENCCVYKVAQQHDAATVSVIGVARYSRAWLGVAVAVAAGAAFAIANTSAGVAYQGGSNPLTVASTRFLLPTAALIAWLSFMASLSFFRNAKPLLLCYSER